MSGNARRSHSDHKRATRILTWSCLALIPVLAILTLGSAVLPTLTGETPSVPGGLQIADTRALSAVGDDLASLNQAGPANSLNDFMNSWQDTVRRRPSPRR